MVVPLATETELPPLEADADWLPLTLVAAPAWLSRHLFPSAWLDIPASCDALVEVLALAAVPFSVDALALPLVDVLLWVWVCACWAAAVHTSSAPIAIVANNFFIASSC